MANFKEILVSSLHLDPENPRLPERLKQPGTQEQTILNWMLEDATLVDLIASISENGFFPGEPIIVIKRDANSFIVIEGNRRLAAIKTLNNPNTAEISKNTIIQLASTASLNGRIPTSLWVYIAESREEIENYLGFRHVTGVKQWPTISKARYLHSLFVKKQYYPGIFKELAREIGSKGVYVRRLIYAYELFKKIESTGFYGIEELDEETFDLSLITDAAVQNANIAEYMGFDFDNEDPISKLDQEKLKEVTLWLYKRDLKGNTRLGENRNLRVLNKVLGNQRAKKVFIGEGRSLAEAAQYTDLMDESIRSFLNKSYSFLLQAQQIVHLSDNPSKEDITLLDDILSSTDVIQGQLRKVLRNKQSQEA